MKGNLYVCGAPASGKSTFAAALAAHTGAEAVDLDREIAGAAGMDIPEIFRTHGESAFRDMESAALEKIAGAPVPAGGRITALGGGTLLRESNRALAERTGRTVCIDTPSPEEIARRIGAAAGSRPLGDKSTERAGHYASFPRRIASFRTVGRSLVIAGKGIAEIFLDGLPYVADAKVASLWKEKLPQNRIAEIPSGEEHKTPATIASLWSAFAAAGLGRKDVVAAVGGGVTGDLTGFAAATWMRGIGWINFPTTLLSMVDASTGGKTGCDLPEGKNLAGAFHPPELVVIDTDFLATLDAATLSQGRAEMIKHEIIGALEPSESPRGIPSAAEIARNLAVKIAIVEEDPFEKTGRRMLLNCGHTVGHAIELATSYCVSHGEAVAAGCVEEARIAEREGLAAPGWADSLAGRFAAAGLSPAMPQGISLDSLIPLMRGDKKRAGSTVVFALPCGNGDVRPVAFDLSKGMRRC